MKNLLVFYLTAAFATTISISCKRSAVSMSRSSDSVNKAQPSIIPANNVAILYSPYNWSVNSDGAKTIDAGAYFKINFTGTTCALNFDTTGNGSPFSQIWVKVDNADYVKYSVASTIKLIVSGSGMHNLAVVIKSTSESLSRWAPQATAVVFKSITIDNAATVSLPSKRGKSVLFYGDSITEGVRTDGTSQPDVDRNDAMAGWAWKLKELLNIESGIVGFGGSGVNVSGSGGVPAINASYNYLWSGQQRNFSTAPDLIIINEGTNDPINVTENALLFINNLLKDCPTSIIIILRPFNNDIHAVDWQNAIARCNNPLSCYYVNTAGFFNTTLSFDGIHPSAAANDIIASDIYNAIKQFI